MKLPTDAPLSVSLMQACYLSTDNILDITIITIIT